MSTEGRAALPTDAAPPPAPAAVDALITAAGSAHRRAVTAALAGEPLLVHAHRDVDVFTSVLLAAAAARGRRAVLLAGAGTAAGVRAELGALGLGELVGGASPGPDGGPGTDSGPGTDETRRQQVRDRLERRTRLLHERPGADVPSPFEALAETGTGSTAAPDPDRLDAVDRLGTALGALADVTARLAAELSWEPLRTLGDAERAVDLLQRAESAARTYVPLAFGADLAQLRAVLTAPSRSFLSGEERARRREVRRIAGLRHDGAFGVRDLDELDDLQRAWAARASGRPRAWPARADLAGHLTSVRRLLGRVGAALPEVPADAADLDLTTLPALADEVGRLVRPLRQRARAGAALTDLDAATGGDPADLAAEFRALDVARARDAARALDAALAQGRAARVRIVATVADLPDPADADLLVVADAAELGADAAVLTGWAARVVVVAATDGDAAAWPGLTPHDLGWSAPAEHAATSAVRGAIATALRAAGLSVVEGADVAGYPVDLLVTGGAPGPSLAVDLDGAGYAALPTVRDRDAVRPAQLERAGLGVHRVWVTRWVRDADGEIERTVEAWRRLEDAERGAREDAERGAREDAERGAREDAERGAREDAERGAREDAERGAREDAERAAREDAERGAREDAERAAREDAERAAREDAERAAREDAERAAREDAERAARAAREDAARAAREDAERAAREDAERAAREDAERAAREDAERAAREDAERAAREDAARAAREDAERAAREDAERAAREDTERAAREDTERAARAARAAREDTERAARAARAAREDTERAAREDAERAAERNPEPRPEPAAVEETAAEPEPSLPPGLGRAADAEARIAEFTDALAGVHPNVDQTPPDVVDAAVALAYGRLGLGAADPAVLEAAMDVVGFRRRGVKVQRAFKESVQRSKKKMRGAGVKIS